MYAPHTRPLSDHISLLAKESASMANTYVNKLRISGSPDRLREYLKQHPGMMGLDEEPYDNQHYVDADCIQGQLGFHFRSNGPMHEWVQALAAQHDKLIFDLRFYDAIGCHIGMRVFHGTEEPEGDEYCSLSLSLPWDKDMTSYPGPLRPELADWWAPWFGHDYRRDNPEYDEYLAKGIKTRKPWTLCPPRSNSRNIGN